MQLTTKLILPADGFKKAKTCSTIQNKSYCLKNMVVIDGPFMLLSNAKGYKN
jgi:hypothetical protein